MIIKSIETKQKTVGAMKINEYKINSDFSLDVIELNGEHGMIKCLNEDRIYFILEGTGRFTLDSIETEIEKNDLVFVPKKYTL